MKASVFASPRFHRIKLRFFCLGAISGLIALIALECMTPAFYYIPSAALGAMMLMAVLTMVEMSITKSIWKLHKWDLLPFLAAFGTSFYKLEYGVMSGTGLAIIIMLSREARPKYFLEKDHVGKSVTLLLMENLTYPGVDAVNKTIYSEVNNFNGIETLILDMSTMVRVDYSILKNFEFLREELSKKGIALRFVNFSRESIKRKFLNADLIVSDSDKVLTTKIESTIQDKEMIGDTSKIKFLKAGLTEEEDIALENSVEKNNNAIEESSSYVENLDVLHFKDL